MIVVFRIDDRLLHGQVARSWTKQYNIEKIVIINDEVMNDEFSKMTLRLAKPQEVDLIFSDKGNSEELLKRMEISEDRVMCIVNGFEDAMIVLPFLPKVKKINIGGLRSKSRDSNIVINPSVVLTNKDKELVEKLLNDGYILEIRQVPGERPYFLEKGNYDGN